MIYSSDENEIFRLLDKAAIIIHEPSRACMTDFYFDGDLFFLLYFPGHSFRACYLYRLDGSDPGREIRNELLPSLLSLPEKAEFAALKTEALDRVEKLLSEIKPDASWFDAH